jgi:mycofactocin precursor
MAANVSTTSEVERPTTLAQGSEAEVRIGPHTAAMPGTDEELVLENLLVEDVSIDGMCGVY